MLLNYFLAFVCVKFLYHEGAGMIYFYFFIILFRVCSALFLGIFFGSSVNLGSILYRELGRSRLKVLFLSHPIRIVLKKIMKHAHIII